MNAKEIYRTVRNAVLSVPIALTLAVAPVYATNWEKAGDKCRYLPPQQQLTKEDYKNPFIVKRNGKYFLDLKKYEETIEQHKAIGMKMDDFRIIEKFLEKEDKYGKYGSACESVFVDADYDKRTRSLFIGIRDWTGPEEQDPRESKHYVGDEGFRWDPRLKDNVKFGRKGDGIVDDSFEFSYIYQNLK
jgi:hypothetical protein